MPEPPDFDQIARRSVERIVHSEWGNTIDSETVDFIQGDVAEQLRFVWNARGAADLAEIERTVTHASDTGIVLALDHAIRTLDA